MSPHLFTPLDAGALRLKHRVVMAPLTRMRADPTGNTPRPLNVEYYAQRATPGGLIVAEASQISPTGQGYPQTPGIYSPEQIAGWREVTSAVHAKGGLITLQLWHVGRVSHSGFQPDGASPVAPSAVAARGKHFAGGWAMDDFQTPRALETVEVEAIVEGYRQGAQNALAAGFDGVELHGANGYLIEQFLQSRSNRRTDKYGGSITNRIRLLQEVTAALVEVAGSDRVGVRLSPFGAANDSGEDEPIPLYRAAISALAEFKLAYLHLIEPRATLTAPPEGATEIPSATTLFRRDWPGVLIGAGGYDGPSAEAAVAGGTADAIAFGRAFIANPDLVQRLRVDAPWNPQNRATFYGGDAAGYTDYPTLEQVRAQAEPAE